MSCFCVTRARTTKIWIFCWSFFIASHLFVFSSFFPIFFLWKVWEFILFFFFMHFLCPAYSSKQILEANRSECWTVFDTAVYKSCGNKYFFLLFFSSHFLFPASSHFFFFFFFSWFVLRGTSGSGVVCSNCLAIPLCPFIARNWTLSPLI